MSYKAWYIANHCINYFAIIQIDSFMVHLNFELTLILLLLVFLPSLLHFIFTHFQFHPLTKYNWLIHVNWTIIAHIFTLLSLNIIFNLNISARIFQIGLILPCHFSNFKIPHSPSQSTVHFSCEYFSIRTVYYTLNYIPLRNVENMYQSRTE